MLSLENTHEARFGSVLACDTPSPFKPMMWGNIRPVPVKPQIAECVRAASEVFGVPVEQIVSSRRFKKIIGPRQAAMYVARQETGASYPMIGQRIGNRDHTTVMYAEKQVRHRLKDESSVWPWAIKQITERAQELACERVGRAV